MFILEIVKNENGKLTTTSKIISDVFGKVHKKVILAIDNLECSDKFRFANYSKSFYMSPQNKKIKCYDITEDGFYFLCMGFTGKKAAEFKESFIETFKQMRNGLLNIDSEMTKLSKQGEELKRLGGEWSRFGHQINKEKKAHDKSVAELINKVQLKLDV